MVPRCESGYECPVRPYMLVEGVVEVCGIDDVVEDDDAAMLEGAVLHSRLRAERRFTEKLRRFHKAHIEFCNFEFPFRRPSFASSFAVVVSKYERFISVSHGTAASILQKA